MVCWVSLRSTQPTQFINESEVIEMNDNPEKLNGDEVIIMVGQPLIPHDTFQSGQFLEKIKKNKAKIAMGRRKAANKQADTERLKTRARRQAIDKLFQKLSKGEKRSNVSAARRQSIEKRLEKMRPAIDKLTRKMLPSVRKMERERRQSK